MKVSFSKLFYRRVHWKSFRVELCSDAPILGPILWYGPLLWYQCLKEFYPLTVPSFSFYFRLHCCIIHLDFQLCFNVSTFDQVVLNKLIKVHAIASNKQLTEPCLYSY